MSRSRGAMSLTTWSPIRSSPSVMSSSPAIIRSAVDFPHPEGPTRIMNSPSLISRFMSLTASKPSANRFEMFSRTISAIWSGLLSSGNGRGPTLRVPAPARRPGGRPASCPRGATTKRRDAPRGLRLLRRQRGGEVRAGVDPAGELLVGGDRLGADHDDVAHRPAGEVELTRMRLGQGLLGLLGRQPDDQ